MYVIVYRYIQYTYYIYHYCILCVCYMKQLYLVRLTIYLDIIPVDFKHIQHICFDSNKFVLICIVMIVMQMLTVPVGSAHWKYRRNNRKMLATSTGIFFVCLAGLATSEQAVGTIAWRRKTSKNLKPQYTGTSAAKSWCVGLCLRLVGANLTTIPTKRRGQHIAKTRGKRLLLRLPNWVLQMSFIRSYPPRLISLFTGCVRAGFP